MAYSKAPQLQTYETKRVSFISNPQQRSSDSTKDFRLVNMMTEAIPSPLGDAKKYYVKSRPGLSETYSATAGEGRGMYYWVVSGVGHVITVIGNTVYSNGTAVITLTTSTGECGFTEFVTSTGIVTLILLDGIKGYVFDTPTTYKEIASAATTAWVASTAYDSGTVIRPTVDNTFVYRSTAAGTSAGTEPTWPTTEGGTVVDNDITWTCELYAFPTPHIPIPIFLDAYLFVAKADSEDVYNSNLDDPTAWTAGDYISAEMYPDKLVALSKNNNYLYAIGSNSVEYLYDNAITTGSPLERNAGAVQQFGCAAIGTVVQTETEVIFVGETGNGGHTVWTIDGFKGKEIGIAAVKSSLLAEGASLSTAKAHCIRVSGQKLYILCLSQRTWVYSFDSQMWHEWQTGTGVFVGGHGGDGPNGSSYILGISNGKTYLMNETLFTDAGTSIACSITTNKLDFDTINRKFMHRLSLIGDVPDSTLVDSAVTIQWSDDDYKTWSPARTLKFTPDLPAMFQLGQFRRRSFKISYSLSHLLRMEGMEVDINKGNA